MASLHGLHHAVPKTADTIQALYGYIPVAPLACKESLLKLVAPLPLPDNAKLLLLFINPAEREQLRLAAVRSCQYTIATHGSTGRHNRRAYYR